MEQSNLKTLTEITPDTGGFDLPVSNRLKVMFKGITVLYLSGIRASFQLPYTSKLLFYLENSDGFKGEQKSSYSLGNENTPSGSANAWVSGSKFKDLSDDIKRKELLDTVHRSFLMLAEKGSQPTEVLHKAYNDISISDFFYNSYKEFTNSNGKFIAQVQRRDNWDDAEYRLSIKNVTTGAIKYYPLKSNPHHFIDEIPGLTQENMWPIMLNTIRFFDPIKWTGNRFILHWGKEKFTFDIKTEKLTYTE